MSDAISEKNTVQNHQIFGRKFKFKKFGGCYDIFECITIDDSIHLKIAHDLKVLQKKFKDKDANDLQNRSTACKESFTENHSTTNEEPITKVIFKATEKICKRKL